MRRVDHAGSEHLAERAVEKCDILAVILADHVPGGAARIRRKDDDAARLGAVGHDRQHIRGGGPGAVQHDEEWRRPVRREQPRNAQQPVPRRAHSELSGSGSRLRGWVPGRPRGQDAL